MFSISTKSNCIKKNTPALVYGEFKRAENIDAPVFCYYREYNDELYFMLSLILAKGSAKTN